MSIGNKIIISCVIITTFSSAMEKSQPLAIVNQHDPLTQAYTIPIPSFNNVYASMANGWDSLKSTVSNTLSDDSAFKKLGWPPSDILAQQELKNSVNLYKRVNGFLKEGVSYETFVEDCNAIARRNGYCQRVLQSLALHPDGVDLALFCINNHQQVMNSFDLSRFLLFVNVEQEKSKKKALKVDQELADLTIVPRENELLNHIFEQTVQKKEIVKQIERKEVVKQIERKK